MCPHYEARIRDSAANATEFKMNLGELLTTPELIPKLETFATCCSVQLPDDIDPNGYDPYAAGCAGMSLYIIRLVRVHAMREQGVI